MTSAHTLWVEVFLFLQGWINYAKRHREKGSACAAHRSLFFAIELDCMEKYLMQLKHWKKRGGRSQKKG